MVLALQPGPQSPDARPSATSAYVPQRVYDTRRHAFTDFETMVADLARADVVLVGEQHDDPNTHRLETAVLEGFARRHLSVTLSLEMFERDVQPSLDTYVAGTVGEDEFLKASRPWPRYATDYRALVELAKAQRWPVVAANVPRRIASDVAKTGRPAVDSLGSADRALAAHDLECPHDGYFDRFSEQMGSHQAPGATAAAASDTTERYYWAQCVKDETMAESIAAAFAKEAGRPGVIVHFTGAFHSDFGTGTGERVRRRLEGRRVTLVSMMPVDDLDTLAPAGDDLKRADYLVSRSSSCDFRLHAARADGQARSSRSHEEHEEPRRRASRRSDSARCSLELPSRAERGPVARDAVAATLRRCDRESENKRRPIAGRLFSRSPQAHDAGRRPGSDQQRPSGFVTPSFLRVLRCFAVASAARGRRLLTYFNLSGISAITYAITAIAADARDMSIGSILSIVSACVWWIRK